MFRILSWSAAAYAFAIAALSPQPAGAATPALKKLASFNGADGQHPDGGVILDSYGDLLGTTSSGAGYGFGDGTVFEIFKTFQGYANTPYTIFSFSGSGIGKAPFAGLVADAYGNLFGTTYAGGSYGLGGVFEIPWDYNPVDPVVAPPFLIVDFCGSLPNCADGANPNSSLIIDADGNLLGTTSAGGSYNMGTVFEIAKTSYGYATTLTTLASFCSQPNCADGAKPNSSLIIDANGNLLGTTSAGGAYNAGTVFEIAKTSYGYASTITPLAFFTSSNGNDPIGPLIADAYGNLFGTTFSGGSNDQGTIFEVAKTSNGYASTPTVLYDFDGAHGAYPPAGLLADRNGNLFGTTLLGGANNSGTVFELTKTNAGYASLPTILASFHGGDGRNPRAGLIADAAGNLFGTTDMGGVYDLGTVFEITNSGFATSLVFAGKPGTGSCYGESVLALIKDDRNLDAAAQVLGLDNAEALQTVIHRHCRRSLR